MNGDLEALRQVIQACPGRERALTLDAPLYQSADSDCVIVGFSFVEHDSTLVIVEANHVVWSLLETTAPVAFTTRTHLNDEDPWTSLTHHARDYLRVTRGRTQDELIADPTYRFTQADASDRLITFDGAFSTASAITMGDDDFILVLDHEQGVDISIVAPSRIVDSGFVSFDDSRPQRAPF